jgi:echinoderm microtubule-associated protein-like 1/2
MKLKGHSSFITCIDWSLDEDKLRSVCGAYELLFWNVSTQGGTQDTRGASNTLDTVWDSHSAKFGWRVTGIFPPGTDGSHVNIVEEAKIQNLIATGDDYGLVNIYRNPCEEKHQAKSYRGHSEHVMNVKFMGEQDEYMVSAGGEDKTVIQWKL